MDPLAARGSESFHCHRQPSKHVGVDKGRGLRLLPTAVGYVWKLHGFHVPSRPVLHGLRDSSEAGGVGELRDVQGEAAWEEGMAS